MHPAARHVVIIALLGLLVGHATLAIHAASHPLADAAECELCISYGDATLALPESPLPTDWPGRHADASCATGTEPSPADALHYRQRGPPSRH